MVMSDSTPKRPYTRSTSTPNVSLSDIKQLINNSKKEIISIVSEKFDSLNTTLSFLISRVEKIEENLASVNEVNKKHEEQFKVLKTDFVEMAKEMPVRLLSEVEERNYRRPNLIFSGISELTSGSIDDRKSFDVAEISKIANELELSIDSGFKTTRIGKLGGAKPRLLRATFSRIEERNDLLRKGKCLRNSKDFKQVYINPDLTSMQRTTNKFLRAELRRRREAGEQVIIRGEKIVDVRRDQNFS